MYKIENGEKLLFEIKPYDKNLIKIKVKSYCFSGETFFYADNDTLKEFAINLKEMYDNLEDKVDLIEDIHGHSKIIFIPYHNGHISIMGYLLTTLEDGCYHELNFTNHIDQTHIKEFVENLYNDYIEGEIK